GRRDRVTAAVHLTLQPARDGKIEKDDILAGMTAVVTVRVQ
ncbi:hypothetical protein Q604_UNBC03456G0001, partial [human gut metagenome]